MKAQITIFMLLGVILLVGLLTVLAYVVLIVTGTIADPFVASDVTSYFNTCFEQTLQCSLYQKGLAFELKDLSALQQETQAIALDDFPVCLRNLSQIFRGRVSLEEGSQKISLFFADRTTDIALESPASVMIGKASKRISGVVASKPVAFSRILDAAKGLDTGRIEELDSRYRAYFFETAGDDVVVLRDVESNISYRNPYTVVFSVE